MHVWQHVCCCHAANLTSLRWCSWKLYRRYWIFESAAQAAGCELYWCFGDQNFTILCHNNNSNKQQQLLVHVMRIVANANYFFLINFFLSRLGAVMCACCCWYLLFFSFFFFLVYCCDGFCCAGFVRRWQRLRAPLAAITTVLEFIDVDKENAVASRGSSNRRRAVTAGAGCWCDSVAGGWYWLVWAAAVALSVGSGSARTRLGVMLRMFSAPHRFRYLLSACCLCFVHLCARFKCVVAVRYSFVSNHDDGVVWREYLFDLLLFLLL